MALFDQDIQTFSEKPAAGQEVPLVQQGHGFGTAPVFLAAISTILGAIMFLRFGYAVGHLGFLGALMVILIGHMVTIPTAMAIAEIATNRRVEGGGEYYMISRSFGTTIGGTIGVSLYLSQAVSVAFYMIAFAEAFRPLLEYLNATYGIQPDPRYISLPATMLLVTLMLTKGADLGVRALWVVCSILALALGVFFLGHPVGDGVPAQVPLNAYVENPDPFTLVFAICFPAFTGMTAGVGLSGDLKNPRRSIPLGTLAGTIAGMITYVFIALKLAANASPEQLANDQFIMAKIALWGPAILIGLGAATLSSAVGSIMIAPRTLQALGRDGVLPKPALNELLAKGRGASNEPANATLLTGAFAILFVLAGDVDFVAQIISMFFMVTYGAICSISFLEHFAGNPSYRPTFRSHWYISLLGGVMCFMMMFQMQPGYAILSILVMVSIYQALRYTRKGERDLTAILQGVLFQMTRRLHIAVQRTRAGAEVKDWRPSFVILTRQTANRRSHFDLLRWICHRHGFGQFIHLIEGDLTIQTERHARVIRERLIRRSQTSRAGIFVDTIVAPNYSIGLAEVVQRPGISGMPNNSVLFEFSQDHPDEIGEILDSVCQVDPLGFNVCVLRSSNYQFGYRKNIHVWLTTDDYVNAPLMILLAYIIVGHPEWSEAEISIFACYPYDSLKEETAKLNQMIKEGRLPIPSHRVGAIPYNDELTFEKAVGRRSRNADLVILGLPAKCEGADLARELIFHPDLNDVLFVRAAEQIAIS